MREIKFRAKALFNGTIGSNKWIYGSNINIAPHGDTYRLYINGIRCDYKTLGQYTGLRDCNDEDIYEGDIVTGSFMGNVFTEQVTWNVRRAGFIAGYTIDMGNYDGKSELEIIGNIYDNPELREDKK